MKHDSRVTVFLVSLFLLTQVVGLAILTYSMNVSTVFNEETGETEVVIEDADVFTGRPDTTGSESFTFIVISIILGTGLVLLIMRLGLNKLWKSWFYFAIALTLAITFSVFVPDMIALVMGIVFAYLKVFRPNIFTHNFTEVLMYSGIAVLLVPIFGDPSNTVWILPENVFWMFMILAVISVYDAYAVWKSKHMVSMAKFQAKNKLFAGLLIPYAPKQKLADIKFDIPKGIKEEGTKSAILGGGDIAFPLLFAGAVVRQFIVLDMVSPWLAFAKTLIIPAAVTVALGFLLVKGRKNTFYPAMPFISAGCIAGYLLLMAF